ncbi:pentapeptide repeat-containing protein [Micromonospora sp. ALFpr18c]|uniref:pentapeptide repeat-containing protein n=1 Tax=unclassified Micromonospora TaxID=2617518 RepID=UPI00124B530C|nr:pentapeptide repeat-containing protein [Micromonospora sp. ALFpr18c]KAB1940917.1 pentapeptide repeat-containing protein [Micromonospora sp. ALFpr18c]
MPPSPAPPPGSAQLRADCGRCFGLCCVVPAFARSADFAIDKPAGQPCPNLRTDHRCGIHTELRQRGFPGCTVFDCFGAGQQVAQVTFNGRDWRDAPGTLPAMAEAFAVLRPLHELLWYLTEALTLRPPADLRVELERAHAETWALCGADPTRLRAVDTAAHRDLVNPLLARASDAARSPGGADRRGAQLLGADLRRVDLRRANLRGALLVGADLRGADLSLADVTGADLRGADLRGADLRSTLFLHQAQLDAARGDTRTGLPAALTRPAHWTALALTPVRQPSRSATSTRRGRRR